VCSFIITLSVIGSSREKRYIKIGLKKKRLLLALFSAQWTTFRLWHYLCRGCCYSTSVVFVSKVEKLKVNGLEHDRKRSIVFQSRYFNGALGELYFFSTLFTVFRHDAIYTNQDFHETNICFSFADYSP